VTETLFAITFPVAAPFWVYLDSRERGRHPVLMAPVLLLTIMFGPLGLLTYLAIRPLRAKDLG
jgi:hypothetical protein